MNNYTKLIKIAIIVSFFSCIHADKNEDIKTFVMAARDGDFSVVQKMLQEKKVSINDRATDLQNQTALMAAVYRKPKTSYTTEKVKEKRNVVFFLLQQGADTKIKNDFKQTALDLANLALATIELARLLKDFSEQELNDQERTYKNIVKVLQDPSLLLLYPLHQLTLELNILADVPKP